MLIHLIANSSAAYRAKREHGVKLRFLRFFNESRRTKVPKPYSKERMSSGTFKDISQSDRPRTRSVKTKNKRHRGEGQNP